MDGFIESQSKVAAVFNCYVLFTQTLAVLWQSGSLASTITLQQQDLVHAYKGSFWMLQFPIPTKICTFCIILLLEPLTSALAQSQKFFLALLRAARCPQWIGKCRERISLHCTQYSCLFMTKTILLFFLFLIFYNLLTTS